MKCFFLSTLAAAVVALSVGVAQAITLRVDFGTTDSPLQTGFEAFARGLTSPQANLADPQSEVYGGVTVTIEGTSTLACPNCGTGWRNRGPITGPFASLSDLLGDEVKSNGNSMGVGDSLFLTLGDLPLGSYQLLTYHHERAIDNGTIDIFLVGNPVALVSDLQQSFGDSPSSITTAALNFTASGGPIQFEFREKAEGGTGASEAVLNGFELVLLSSPAPIPEPSSWMLAGLGAIGLALRRRASARRAA